MKKEYKFKCIVASIGFLIGGALGQLFFPLGLLLVFVLAIMGTATIAQALYSKGGVRPDEIIFIAVAVASFLFGGAIADALFMGR